MSTTKKLLLPLIAIILLGLFAAQVFFAPQIISAQQTVACEKDVTVKAGDWLSTIAQAEYGDVSLYPALAAATSIKAASDSSYTAIPDPAVIKVGMKICVPSKADAQAITAAYKAEIAKTPAANSTPAASNTPAAGTAPAQIARLRQLDFAPFKDGLAAFTSERAAAVAATIKDADIAQVQDAVKAGKLTYAELTLYFLSNIQKQDETLRTMVELNPDALKDAQAADQLLKDGKAASLMLGIPVTLKDNIETAAPMHTTGGSEILLNNQPKADASFVKQLRDAGAVILGKANLSELAGGIAIQPPGASAVGGQTHNPHGDFSAGGSSSGSGAGTAAYETMVSVGSETAGSLIVPATWNGVVGMYPSKGVVDSTHVIPLIHNNDSAGPIGRNVKDVAALLGVIDTTDTDYVAGLDPKALNGVNAAFLKADVLANKGNALENTADNAAVVALIEKGLTGAGAKVTDIELTPAGIGGQLESALLTLITGGVRHDMVPYLVNAGAPIKTLEDLAAYNEKEPKTRIPFGQVTVQLALGADAMKDPNAYQEAVTQIKAAAVAALEAAFADNKADVLVSVSNYNSGLYATANYPAITVPLGLRANGMPIGVTLIGKPGSEAKLLAYAYAFEQATKLRIDPDLSKIDAPAANSTPAPAASTFGKAWTPVACESLGVNKVYSEAADCGYVTVPEKRGESGTALGDKMIQLGVVRIRATGDKHGTPVVLGTGGPGGYGLSSIQTALDPAFWIKPHLGILEDRDYVMFTQRGTKGAKPDLNCPEYDIIEFQSALEGWSEQQIQDQINKSLAACRDKFTAAGVDFSAYNTDENAVDIKDIAETLGYDKIIYYGQSYGTMLGQFLMRNHPEILEAVILDGVAQVKNTSYAQMVNLQDSFRRVFDACKVDADCNANYPDLENTLVQVYDAFQKNPSPVILAVGNETATLKVNGDMLLNGMLGEMYGGGGVDLPKQIYALKANDPLVVKKLAPNPPSALNAFSRIQHFAINCSDDPITSDEPAQKDLLPMYASIARADNRNEALACKVLAVPQLPDASDAAVKFDLPVLIVNGGLDPVTPTSNGQVVAETLPNSQLIVLPGGGHVQDQDACAIQIMKAFMENPSAKVDTSCIPAKPVFSVPVKADVKDADGKTALTLTLPAGFVAHPQVPNTWLQNSGLQTLQVKTYPAGTSGQDAISAFIKGLPFTFQDTKIVDGEAIDGNPTQVLAAVAESGGVPLAERIYAIQGKQGTYIVWWNNQDVASEQAFEQGILASILSSIKLNAQ